MTEAAASSPLVWQDGLPRSRLFGDIYYSLEDGLAETRAVFLQGCDLPAAWAGRRRFCVGELGFGTGLNIAALLELWRRERPVGAHLHIFSTEAFPLNKEEAAKALGAWPEIGEPAQALLARWPGSRRGYHRLEIPQFSATFDLAIMDVEAALKAWSGPADAWFLDGFSPALNPQMWRDEVLALVGDRSAPGARAATFTVAGAVRRGLTCAGFEVAKRPGHGRKRERLEARKPGHATEASQPDVIIIGAGIAGASLARAFSMLGVTPRLIAPALDAKASGNRAALVTPAFDAGGGARAAFYAQAFARAVQLYDQTEDAVLATGALQLEVAMRDATRFDAVAAQDIFDPEALQRLDPKAAAGRLGEDAAPGAIDIKAARVVEPAKLLKSWAPASLEGEVESLAEHADGWRITLLDGRALTASVVIVAAGWGSAALGTGLAIAPVRGQASFCATDDAIVASASGGYAIPAPGGVLFGATHDRGVVEVEADPADDDRNLSQLAAIRPALAAALGHRPIVGRAAVRATTADRMPAAGEIAPGLFVLTGLGSRGFTTAPLLAEHVAALALKAPSPLPADLAALVSPARFGA